MAGDAGGPGPGPAVDEALVSALAEQIAGRGEDLRRRIEAHAAGPVQVVAVTKGHPVEVALATVRAGFTVLGENYAQELRDKAPAVARALAGAVDGAADGAVDGAVDGAADGAADGVQWHFIGRLQSNKVRMLAPHVALWESLDRPSVIREVARRAPGAAVLVQVDLAGIEGRGGCARPDAPAMVGLARELGLDVRGLMGVGPPGGPEHAREGFRWLRAEAEALGLLEVSMGMSADLEVALEEGSTMVRVGSALVGPRPPR
jgi:hypothetical protein